MPSINGRPKILWWIACALSMVLTSVARHVEVDCCEKVIL